MNTKKAYKRLKHRLFDLERVVMHLRSRTLRKASRARDRRDFMRKVLKTALIVLVFLVVIQCT